jgi:hypothetical protein
MKHTSRPSWYSRLYHRITHTKLARTDIIAFFSALLLITLIRNDFVLIMIYLLTYPYLILTGRRHHIKFLALSSILSLIWITLAKDQYGYNKEMLFIFGFPLFPLLTWAAGLFAAYMAYSYLARNISHDRHYHRGGVFLATYWPMLIFFETAGYHLADIKNTATSMYTGLPLCDCMHAPWWMKLAYFSLGPIYFGLCMAIQKKK